MFVKLYKCELVEYHRSSVVKISGLRTADHKFESAWGFCSYLLNHFFENHNFLSKSAYFFSPI